MSDESKINVASGFNGGVSVSLRANSSAEFEALLADAQTSPTLAALLAKAGLAATEAQAVANVQAAFPQAQVSTVGQPLHSVSQNAGTPGLPLPNQAPLPQPQPVAQPAAPAAPPPTVPYPGDCPHGVRVYVDKPARGRPWRRFECAIPWSKENAATRCKPVNVEG